MANCLGVSTPAVNKWENGNSCPDIELLCPLARLLKTDVNELLGFREELTEKEIADFVQKAAETAQEKGFGEGMPQKQKKSQKSGEIFRNLSVYGNIAGMCRIFRWR